MIKVFADWLRIKSRLLAVVSDPPEIVALALAEIIPLPMVSVFPLLMLTMPLHPVSIRRELIVVSLIAVALIAPLIGIWMLLSVHELGVLLTE
jgi:hypothetical protein